METKATNVVWHEGHVERKEREGLLKQKGCTIWLTGLPSSGKSTIAFTLEHMLIQKGQLAYVLDGDNIRHGLNRNLGFSAEEREENIRRIGEVSKLFANAGFISITSFISPYRADRDRARRMHEASDLEFIEIHVSTPVDTCEERDPKGLYKKARKGEIKGFTGVDDPYEEPQHPELRFTTLLESPEEIARMIISELALRHIIRD